MISGSGAQMQSTSYIPAYYHIIDQNVGGSGSLWQALGSGSSTCKIGMVYNVLPESPNPDPCLAYSKEILRQTMLKHEAVFRNQVHELHRLYSRQKELMNEVSRNRWQMQCSQSNLIPSQVQYNIFQKAYYPPAQFGGNFQIPSTHLVSQESIRAGSMIYIKENSLEEQRNSMSKVCYSGKRLLDLQLPAEEYIDSEDEQGLKERNPVQMPQVQYDHSQTTSPSPTKNTLKLNKTSSSNGSTNYSKTTFLFDLNEPIQLDESETPNSADFINSSCTDIIMPQDQDSFGKSKLGFHVQNEESTRNVPEGKGDEGSGLISGLQDSMAGVSIPLCGDRTSLASDVAKKESEAFDDNNQSVLHSSVTNSCSPALKSNEVKTEASTSVTSQQTSVCNFREVPFAIQALPCFNIPDLLSKTSRSSSSSSGIKRKYCNSKGNPASTPSLGSVSCCCKTGSSDNEHAADQSSPVECVKKSRDANSSEDIVVVDVLPQNCLPKAEVSQEKHSRTDEVSSSENSKRQFSRPRMNPDFDGTNLKATVSPDKNEHPPSEDFDRIAAEAIVSISSSDIQQRLKNENVGPAEVSSSDCLSWFASIASSVTSDQEIEFEFERLSPRNNQNILTGDDDIGFIETSLLKFNGMNLEDCCPQTSNQNCKMQSHHQEEEQGRGKKKTRQKKGSLSCITSLHSSIVTKNLQPGAGGSTSRTIIPGKRCFGLSRRRRSRKLKKVISNEIETKVCSILKQHTSHELSFTLRSLLGWGSKNRRQKKSRHERANHFLDF